MLISVSRGKRSQRLVELPKKNAIFYVRATQAKGVPCPFGWRWGRQGWTPAAALVMDRQALNKEG